MHTRSPSHRGRAALAVIAAGVLFGTTGTAVVLAHTGASALAIAAVRVLVGSLGLVAVASREREFGHVRRLWRRPVTWLMGLAVVGYMAAYFLAVATGGVAIAALVSISLGPAFAATFARVLGRPWPGRAWAFATALAVLGVILLALPADGAGGDQRLVGAVIATGSSASYGLFTALGGRFADDGHHPTDALAASFAVGALLLLPFLAADATWLLTAPGVGLALWLGLVTTTTSYTLFGHGLSRLSPGVVATLVLSEPAVAVLLSVLVVGEAMPARGWVGCALIGVGLALVARREAAAVPAPA